MKTHLITAVVWIGCGLQLLPVHADDTKDSEFFESRIRPVLVEHCYECHSAASQEAKGGLLLDSRAGVRKGGESGPAIVPGNPAKSLLLDAIRYESFEMPPKEKLPAGVIADFTRWIRDGAFDPRDKPPSPAQAAEAAWKVKLNRRSAWWSLQPLKKVDPPPVQDPDWSRESVDRFLFSALDQAGLKPSDPANAETLLRRLSFVLTGLPPSTHQVKSFPHEYKQNPDAALADLVDKLFSSPHFGERFARHWMDVVRYTDTYGYEWDNPAKGAWEYRDYLIRVFNHDVGFDQMLREQIAGDLLPNPRIDREANLNESLIGPMFYHLGEHRHGTSLEFNGIHQEMVNNKIDAFSKAFLAMTVACARCHDHKLDAISQADYYALAGVMMSPRWTTRAIDAPGKHDVEIEQLKQLRSEIRRELALVWQRESNAGAVSGAKLKEWATKNASLLENVQVENPAYPLARIAKADERRIEDAWQQLASQWLATRKARQTANAEKFAVLSDFANPGLPHGWIAEGDGLLHGYVLDATPLIDLDGELLIAKLLPRGYHTHAISSKLPGSIRLPVQDDIRDSHVSLNLAGGEWAGYLVVPQNAFQTETVTFFDASVPAKWFQIADLALANGVTRVRTEVATSSLNPNFPPRTGKATAGKVVLPADDAGFDKRSWFSLTAIATHKTGGNPADPLDAFVPLYENRQTPATTDQAWEHLADWLTAAVNRWALGKATAGDVTLLDWMLEHEFLPNKMTDAPQVTVLVKRYREIESRIAFPRTVNSMDEREIAPLNYRLNVRGNVDEDGPVVPRDFLEVFAKNHKVGQSPQSGRLELAQYLSRDNPQAARVYVNRVWQWVFGTGIVATPNDFGKLGDRPSHPELLDWLAGKFIEEGWSTKKLVRRLVLSRAFRQSGLVDPSAAERDPANRLLHHYPTRRLEAEAIRDSLLAVSGKLDAKLYGRPIKPPRSAEDSHKRLFSGPLDGNGRRSLYLEMSIMEPPKFLVGFNLPDLKLPTGRRDVTNVPAQALILLNDPFVLQSAEAWAIQLIVDGSETPDTRVQSMFQTALGRNPTPHELKRWVQAVTGFSNAREIMKDQTAWMELAHALFNTKEFLYYK